MSSDHLVKPATHGLAFVISGPAGTGKTTLVDMLRDEFPIITESISCTTRPPRENEVDEEHYHFVSQEEFDAMIEKEEFLEYATLFHASYGTPRGPLVAQLKEGKHVFMVIDTQGALQVRERFPAILIFISPPSMDELRDRLKGRNTESEETLSIRLARAEQELEVARHYDYHIVNEDLKAAYETLRSIVIAEVHRVRPD